MIAFTTDDFRQLASRVSYYAGDFVPTKNKIVWVLPHDPQGVRELGSYVYEKIVCQTS